MNKKYLHPDGRPYTMEEFVEKIKNDSHFAERWGDLGPIYGKQWRSWSNIEIEWGNMGKDGVLYGDCWELEPIDQISNLIKTLKTNPDDRRMIVSAWNVDEVDKAILPPCHYLFQCWTRELTFTERINYALDTLNYEGLLDFGHDHNDDKVLDFLNQNNVPTRELSLMYNARSQDVPLGTPFNVASYGLLLEIIAKTVNMIPGELITNMGDCHIYVNQINGIKEQINRTPYNLPTLKHFKTNNFYNSLSENISLINQLKNDDFLIENYISHPSIKIPLSN